MKKNIIYILIVTLVLLPISLTAQSLKTSYFVKNSTLRHTLNPAFAPDQGYVGMPFVSRIGVGVEGNIGFSDIIHTLPGGKLGTFLHPDISSNDFLSGLDDVSYLNADLDYSIFSMGWNSWKSSFWTVDFDLKLNVNSTIPKEFFELAKLGMATDPQTYSITNFALAQDAYAQLSVGYSQDFDFLDIDLLKGLRVGAKLKFLVGLDDVRVNINSLNINMGSDVYTVQANANAHIYGSGVDFEKDEDGRITSLKITPQDLRPAGYGFGFDLGFEYRFSGGVILDGLLDGLAVSFAANDLGVLFYPKNHIRMAQIDNSLKFDGINNIDVVGMDIEEELDAIQKEIFGLVSLKEIDATKGHAQALTVKINTGIEYSFLKDSKGKNIMSVGFLYTGRLGKLINYNELTLSYNVNPVEWFDVSLSYSFLNYQKSFGWLLNFTPRRGVNFFIGSDYTIFSLVPNFYLPVDKAFFNIQAGISFPIGSKNIRKTQL